MSVLAEMIKTLFGTMRYPEVAEMIMSKITASELAYVLDMLGIKDTFPYNHKFFNPPREVDQA